MATGPSTSAGKKVRAATRTITKISITTKVGVVVRRVPGADGRDLLAGQRAGDGEDREDRDEAAEQHRDAAEGRRELGRPVAGEGAAVVVGLGGVGVEGLGEALRAGVEDRRRAGARS